MTRRRHLWAAVGLWVVAIAPAVDGQHLPFRRYSVDDGLAQSVVFALVEDRDGYLWLGTEVGLSRFDGHRFENVGSVDGLPHNLVRSLFEDSESRLWVGTEAGLAVRRAEGWSEVGLSGLERPSIRCLAGDQDGALWVGTWEHGVVRVRAVGQDRWDSSDGLGDDRVRAALVTRAGEVWFGTYGGGLSRYRGDGVEPAFESFGAEAGLEDLFVRSLAEDREGRIWVGTNGGLHRGRPGEGFERVREPALLEGVAVSAVTAGSGDRMWVGTRDRGACRFGAGETRCFDLGSGLPSNSVYATLEDREGSVWFGTYGAGAVRLSTESILNFPTQIGMPNANVYAFAEDSHGRIWMGTNGGGVSVWDGHSMSRYTTEDGLAHDKVIAAASDDTGGVWLGTLGGACLWREAVGFECLTAADGLAHDIVHDVEVGPDGTVWFGTYRGLSWLRDGEVGSYGRDEGLPADRVNAVVPNSDGSVWLGTSEGVVRYDRGRISKRLGIEDGLPDRFVQHLMVTRDGSIWVGTSNGVARVSDGEVTVYGLSDGVASPMITLLLADADGSVWVGTGAGIHHFDGKRFEVFTARDGLAASEVNRGAGLRDGKGHLWFGTVGGAACFRSDTTRRTLPPPLVHLTRVRALDRLLPLEDEIRLRYDENHLDFEYVGVSLASGPSMSYEYRLEGLDPRWRQTRNGSVQYAALPPGAYAFEVRARNASGIWSEESARVGIEIVPALWQRRWFHLAAIALLVAGVGLWGQRLRRRAALLEERVRERTAEVVRANRELELLALHDPLTGLCNRHYLSLRMPQELADLRRLLRDGEAAECLGLAIIDLDRFKRINDTYGHLAGDRVLEELGRRLRGITRETDIATRWGGDEFLVLFRRTDAARQRATCERIRACVGDRPFAVSDHLFVELTCSVGFTLFPRTVSPGEYQWEQVVAVADLALYEAKSGGRNLVVGLVPDEDDPLGVLAAVESEGRRLLEDRRLRPLGDEAARPDSGRG